MSNNVIEVRFPLDWMAELSSEEFEALLVEALEVENAE